MAAERIVTTRRAGLIWGYLAWASLVLFALSGFAAMMAQTMLPANLGYPQLRSPGVPAWVGGVVVGVEVVAFLVPAVVTTICARRARLLGAPNRRPAVVAWAVFAVVTCAVVLLWVFG